MEKTRQQYRRTMDWNATRANVSGSRGSLWRRRQKTRDSEKINSSKPSQFMRIRISGATLGSRELCNGQRSEESSCFGSQPEIARAMGGEQRRPYTVEDKVRWLGYHDKECAGLPGWLPLAKGMPVALGDHLDRSKKQLLRGRAATIHGWVLHEDEIVGDDDEEVLLHVPRVIVLDFHTQEWHLLGWEAGLCPIFPSGASDSWMGIESTQCWVRSARSS